MKYSVIFFLVFVCNFGFGQIIFNNYYENTNPFWYVRGVDLFESGNSYLYLNKDNGLISVDKINGNNPTVEVNLNSMVINSGGLLKYDAIDASSQNLFFGISEKYSDSFVLTKTDAIVVKTDINNNILWDYRLTNDTSSYEIKSIKGTADGGCVVGGNVIRYYDSLGVMRTTSDAFLIKLSINGGIDWINEFNMFDFTVETIGGGMNYGKESINQLILNPNGSIIVVGKIDHLLCSVGSLWVSHFSNNGSQLWEQFIDPVIQANGWIKYEIWPEDILLTDTKIIIVGSQNLGYTNPQQASYLNNEESYLLELDFGGNIINDTVYSSYGTSSIESICKKNNEYFIVHRAYSSLTDNDDFYISKLNSNNSIDTLATIPNTYCGSQNASESIIDTDGNLIFTGTSGNQTGCLKPWLVKYGFTASGMIELDNSNKKLVKIVNLLGQEVEYTPNTLLLYQYSNGTTEKVFTTEK
jgi:hypothetical protein